MLLKIISIGHLCVFLYCIVCFNVLIKLLAATINKWCIHIYHILVFCYLILVLWSKC